MLRSILQPSPSLGLIHWSYTVRLCQSSITFSGAVPVHSGDNKFIVFLIFTSFEFHMKHFIHQCLQVIYEVCLMRLCVGVLSSNLNSSTATQ